MSIHRGPDEIEEGTLKMPFLSDFSSWISYFQHVNQVCLSIRTPDVVIYLI